MSGNRAKAVKYILDAYNKLDTSGTNAKLVADVKFKDMTDEEFDEWIKGPQNLVMTAPNNGPVKLTVERGMEVANELGIKLFHRIVIPAKDGIPTHLTPNPQLVIVNPVRRQAQMLDKKVSVPTDNNTIDNMTGQPTGGGKSKGASISLNEAQVLNNLDMPAALTEFLKYRGGDEGGFNAMNTMMSRTGTVSLKAIEPYSTGVKSKSTLKSLLLGMMLKATL